MRIRCPYQRVQLCLLIGTILLSGCGGGGTSRNLPKSPVSGTVSYAKPFPKGEVIFKHVSGEITVAKFGADGKYQATVPEGLNKIMIRSQTSSYDDPTKSGKQQEMFTDHIPRRYGDVTTSKTELTVVNGDNKFDIALVD